jgi:hypothetical protein
VPSWKTLGTTPATNKIQYFYSSNILTEEPVEDQFIGPTKDRTRGGEIGPKSHKSIGPIVKSDEFILGTFKLSDVGSPAFMQFFKARRIFFWGWVIYNDVFPQTPVRLTEFCEEVNGIAVMGSSVTNPNPLIPKMRPNLNLKECNQHNCTDEYCSDYQEIVSAVTQPHLQTKSDPFGLDKLK